MHYLTISQLSAALQAKILSPIDVVEHMLARIQALDPVLGAYVTITAERARKQAATAEQEIADGNWRGSLHGIPIAYKDIIYSHFAPTTAGTRIHRAFRPDYSATVLQRLEKAGAVTLGKVVTTEQANGEHHPDVPAPKNPWGAAYWSGASSSGSGVSTAAGLAYAALGSDTAGSIRFPSAANGVTGLKPTWGRVSRHGIFEAAASLDHIGPIARSALDCAIILSVIAGSDPADPTALHDPVDHYEALSHGSIAGVRIGLPRDYATEGIDPQIAKAWEETAMEFEALGAIVEEIRFPDWHSVASQWEKVAAPQAALAHAAHYPARAADYGPVLAQFIERGRKYSAMDMGRGNAGSARVFKSAASPIFRHRFDSHSCDDLADAHREPNGRADEFLRPGESVSLYGSV